MDVFEAVRNSVTAREAAESCGIRVSRNGMACCPFHDDKHPSMKLDNRFHCFACQADGDAINFISRYYDMKPIDAAKKLANDFNIPYDDRTRGPHEARAAPKPGISAELEARKKESECYNTLCDYSRLLDRWEKEYAPKTPDEEWSPRFTEAVQKKAQIEFVLDAVFMDGTPEERKAFIKDHGEEIGLLKGMMKYMKDRSPIRDKDHSRNSGLAV